MRLRYFNAKPNLNHIQLLDNNIYITPIIIPKTNFSEFDKLEFRINMNLFQESYNEQSLSNMMDCLFKNDNCISHNIIFHPEDKDVNFTDKSIEINFNIPYKIDIKDKMIIGFLVYLKAPTYSFIINRQSFKDSDLQLTNAFLLPINISDMSYPVYTDPDEQLGNLIVNIKIDRELTKI